MSPSVRLRRLGYRVAYRVLQVFWMIARPHKEGVKCVLTRGAHVLLVRHTYGSRTWDLPGGGCKRGEQPLETARREMREEVGVSPSQWRDLGLVHSSLDHRRNLIFVYGAEVDDAPLRVDRGEISTAQWFDRHQLPVIGSLCRQILERVPLDDALV